MCCQLWLEQTCVCWCGLKGTKSSICHCFVFLNSGQQANKSLPFQDHLLSVYLLTLNFLLLADLCSSVRATGSIMWWHNSGIIYSHCIDPVCCCARAQCKAEHGVRLPEKKIFKYGTSCIWLHNFHWKFEKKTRQTEFTCTSTAQVLQTREQVNYYVIQTEVLWSSGLD